MFNGLLTATVFIPALGAIVVALLPAAQSRLIKQASLLITAIPLVLAFVLFAGFNPSNPDPQFVDRAPWVRIGNFNVDYFLGVDGLSLPLVFLTALISLLAVLISWNIELRPKEYFALLLLLETGVLGVFTALDFFLFFLFWEVELIPLYLLIGIWGSGRREYAALKFLLYTLAGSAFMLVAILWIYFQAASQTRVFTFDLTQLAATSFPIAFQSIVFFILFFGFAVKLPVFPFHTWLPDAHTEAPTAVSVILAGVLLKMGGYGILRTVLPILPDAARQFAWIIAVLAVVNIIYTALITLVQKDMKRLIAYSSVSHMGYVLLGVSSLTTISLTGAALQMFTHGTMTGLLFACVGLIYDKAHTRQIADLGGLAQRMPIISAIFVIAALASLGLPSMSGFVAELLVFLGSFPVWWWATVLGIVGVLFSAGYLLWLLQRVLFGPLKPALAHVGDATVLEATPIVILVASIFAVGLFPALLTNVISAWLPTMMSRLGAGP